MAAVPKIISQRIPPIDQRTGLFSREWFKWLLEGRKDVDDAALMAMLSSFDAQAAAAQARETALEATLLASLPAPQQDFTPEIEAVRLAQLRVEIGEIEKRIDDAVLRIAMPQAPSVSDHADLTGLAADGHPQYLRHDGTRALSADWDAGSFEIRAQTFESDVITGTAPFVIASTTKVDNLHVARATLADTVTTNANLTGPITSVGNATAIASQTGTGTKFVVDTGPTLVTPVLGVATATSINKVALTAPATSATLTVADGQTLTVNGSATITNGTHSGTNTGDQTDVSGNAGTVTVANEATDTSCYLLFATAASGSLAPKTNVNLTLDSSSGIVTFASTVLTTTDINGGTIDGAVIGGSTAAAGSFTTLDASGLISADGGQIAFPATQSASADANTLDDYEEGAWTPTVTFQTAGNLSVAYSVQVGWYIKIGKLVTATCFITTSTFTHTTASGALLVQGFPFTSENTTNYRAFAALLWAGITTTCTDINVQMLPNTTEVQFGGSTTAAAITQISTAHALTGGTVNLRFTISYRASA